jgi:hypothetical protein
VGAAALLKAANLKTPVLLLLLQNNLPGKVAIVCEFEEKTRKNWLILRFNQMIQVFLQIVQARRLGL